MSKPVRGNNKFLDRYKTLLMLARWLQTPEGRRNMNADQAEDLCFELSKAASCAMKSRWDRERQSNKTQNANSKNLNPPGA